MNTINYLGMDINLDCPKTWDFICKANAIKGIFQLETQAAASGLKKIKPLNIDDLSLVNALNRPGSLKFLNEIAEIREGKKEIEYIDKSLKQYLEFTYGKLCYQESVLQIAQGLAGFKATESNALLKAMGKKLPEVMEKQKEAFVSGMIKNGYEKEFSLKLFSWFSDFANYSFNRSHSISYSLMGYVTAYLKVHFPLQFFRSLLNFTQYEQKPLKEVAEIIEEFPAFNLNILPPSIKKLTNQFEIEDGAIRYPLGLVKNIGEAVYEKLKSLSSEQTRTLDSVLDAFLNLAFNSRSVESMIICGALEGYDMSREDILLYYWFLGGLQDEVVTKFWHYKNGHDFSHEVINNFLNYVGETETNQDDMFQGSKKKNTKGYFKSEATRLKTIEMWQKNCALVDSYKQRKEMCYFFWENKVLGYSNHCQFNAQIKLFKDFDGMKVGETLWSCGFVDETKFRKSAKGNAYAIITLRYDKKREFMLFREISEGAKGTLKAGDFVKFNVKKEENSLKVESICIINGERSKYAFYE